MSDRVFVKGLRVSGRHGVTELERESPQMFEVDVSCELDLAGAGTSDRLDDTLDYSALAQMAARVVGAQSYELLETLANRIADEALVDPRVISVHVRVIKSDPPIALDVGSVGVEIMRRR